MPFAALAAHVVGKKMEGYVRSWTGDSGSSDRGSDPQPGGERYRISREGIAHLWELAGEEERLEVGERVSLVLALTELEQGRSRRGSCS